MNSKQKLWLKLAATIMFLSVEVVTFRHAVLPAFAQSNLGQICIALGSQLALGIGLAGLWLGRTRIAEDAGWASLGVFTLIVSLV